MYAPRNAVAKSTYKLDSDGKFVLNVSKALLQERSHDTRAGLKAFLLSVAASNCPADTPEAEQLRIAAACISECLEPRPRVTPVLSKEVSG